MIYSKNKDEHEKHIRAILNTLTTHKLYAKKSKCEFFLEEIVFLGHVINRDSGKADLEKVKCIEERKTPKDYKDYQMFLGLIGWYRRFIKDFSKLAALLRLFTN